LNKQVFAVLLFNRFVGENPFESGGGVFLNGKFGNARVSRFNEY